MIFVPDSSCLVASLCGWHADHGRARRELDRRLDGGEELILAASTLLESFSVMTRLPAPRRLSPARAQQLLEQNYASRFNVLSLPGTDYRALLQEAVKCQAAGGSVYDLLVTLCARQAGASAIVTFNANHFTRFVLEPMQVVVPT